VAELIIVFRNSGPPIRVSLSAAASEGKKADEGTTMSPSKANMVAVVVPPETQTLTPVRATVRQSSAIRIN
jgi:hypothetical protein